MIPVQAIHFRLAALAAVFVLADPLTGTFQTHFQFLDLARQRIHLHADVAQDFFTLDHAGMCVRVARHAQPVVAQPNAIPGHHGLAGLELPPQRQRLAQRIRGHDRGQHRA